jgi:hypothetical protein
MVFDVARVRRILIECLGGVDVNGEATEGSEVINVYKLIALRPDRVHEYEAEMVELLRNWPREAMGYLIPELGRELSYNKAGYVLEEQRMAFIFFAFGKLLGWWEVLTPESVFGSTISPELAEELLQKIGVAVRGYAPAGFADFCVYLP